jgi:2-aminoadipate transaminase
LPEIPTGLVLLRFFNWEEGEVEDLFSKDARAMAPSAIRALSKVTADPAIISLAGGHPSADSFPAEEVKRILAELSRELDVGVLQYGATAGHPGLRREILGILTERGIRARGEELILCSGSQRGLDLLGRVLLDPGDAVLIEVPSYPGAIACFRNLRVEMTGVPMDGQGLMVDRLEEVLHRFRGQGRRVKLLYTIPNFQNPSGATLSLQRRAAVAELARREGFLILEDDPYGELYIEDGEREKLRPIASISGSPVVYISSFSKILAPGLRTAFIWGPPAIISKLELAAQASDLCSSTLDQRIIYEYCRTGGLARALPRIRTLYREHGEALLAALEENMPQGVEWNRPRGGFFLWMRLPAGLDADAMLQAAIARKVAYVPGRPFCVDGSGANELRLSFSKEPPERLRLGAQALAETIREHIRIDTVG